ncbi:hypothetical protein PQR25_33040 [Paraburkholderia nemoris]
MLKNPAGIFQAWSIYELDGLALDHASFDFWKEKSSHQASSL